MSNPKALVSSVVDRVEPRLTRLADQLHANPEVAWEEHNASRWVADVLDQAGFDVTPSYLGLPTAFLATLGSGAFRIGICAEYDALPGLGHACGHNLIAASSVGAAIALAPVADDLGLRIEVYGTPAEEGGGGKIEMLDRGAFQGLNFAMMAHPAPVDVAEAAPFAVSHSKISFTGRPPTRPPTPRMALTPRTHSPSPRSRSVSCASTCPTRCASTAS